MFFTVLFEIVKVLSFAVNFLCSNGCTCLCDIVSTGLLQYLVVNSSTDFCHLLELLLKFDACDCHCGSLQCRRVSSEDDRS